jgi:hydrogenase/urease accessory protein HupE
MAHGGAHDDSGFFTELSHSFFGRYYVLYLLAVGVLLSRLSRLLSLFTLVTFLGYMLVGSLLVIWGIHIPNYKTAIIASVIVAGVLLTVDQSKLSTALCNMILAFFALLHGFAQAVDIPMVQTQLEYVLITIFMPASLLFFGWYLGYRLKTQDRIHVYGVFTSGIGLYLLLTA